MLYTIVRDQVLSVKSNDVILAVGDSGRSHVHGDDHGRQGVSAGHSDLVDHADKGVSRG